MFGRYVRPAKRAGLAAELAVNERAPALEDTRGVAEVLAEESRRARRRRIAAWSIGIAGVAALALIGWWWWSAGQQRASAHYVTEPVARADILETVVATGTLEPTGKAEVSSASRSASRRSSSKAW